MFLNALRPDNLRNEAEQISSQEVIDCCNSGFLSLAGISDKDIMNVTLPTGVPVLLELDENLHPLGPHQFLGDQEAIQAAIKKVEDQGKVKSAEK